MNGKTGQKQSQIGLYFISQHRGQWLALGLVLLLLVAAIDFATGFKLRLAVLYLLPLLVLTWVMGRLFGVLLSIVACTSWGYLEALNGRYLNQPALLYWDWATVLFGFIVMVVALTELRD